MPGWGNKQKVLWMITFNMLMNEWMIVAGLTQICKCGSYHKDWG